MTKYSDAFPVLIIIAALIAGSLVLFCAKKKKKDENNEDDDDWTEEVITPVKGRKLLKEFSVTDIAEIQHKFSSVDEVGDALRASGLQSGKLIFGVDFTKSNLRQGANSFGGLSLHHIEFGKLNPYQQVIKTLGSTLMSFDDDGLIPAFGFGDKRTQDRTVFPLQHRDGVCSNGFKGVLDAYNAVVESLKFSGPTNFAPVIYKAIEIVKEKKQYHILIVVADGRVTSEAETRKAIVEASSWPLSIIVVGVGDGPWEMMEEYDKLLPHRRFDNFSFVDFHKVTSSAINPDAAFALRALSEIPDQFASITKLGLLQ